MSTNQTNDGEIVVTEPRDRLSVYPNTGGGITIDQSDAMGNVPVRIYVEIEHVNKLIAALRSARASLKIPHA